jgi:predicted NUDIX family NTP pyrophosphohydrolase
MGFPTTCGSKRRRLDNSPASSARFAGDWPQQSGPAKNFVEAEKRRPARGANRRLERPRSGHCSEASRDEGRDPAGLSQQHGDAM